MNHIELKWHIGHGILIRVQAEVMADDSVEIRYSDIPAGAVEWALMRLKQDAFVIEAEALALLKEVYNEEYRHAGVGA